MSVTINGSTGKITESEGSLKIGTTVTMTDGATLPATSLSGTVPAGSLSGATIPASQLTGVVAPANLGTGTADATTFLNGAGAYATVGGGGQLELIQKVVANNSADITITGLGAHDTYLIIGNHLDPVTSSVEDQLTLGKSDGTFATAYFCAAQSLETDMNDTTTHFMRTQGGPAALTMRVNNMIARSNSGVGTGVNNSVNFKYILAANSGTSDGIIYGNFTYPKTNGAMAGGVLHGVSQFLGTTNFDRIKYKFSSGNIDTGSITVFAIKNT